MLSLVVLASLLVVARCRLNELLETLSTQSTQYDLPRIHSSFVPLGYLSVYTYGQISCEGPALSITSVPIGYCLASDDGNMSEMTNVQTSATTYIATITTYNDLNCQSINSTTTIPFFNDVCPSAGFLFKLYYSSELPSLNLQGYVVE